MLLNPNNTLKTLDRFDVERMDSPEQTMRHFHRHNIRGQARLEPLDPSCIQGTFTVTLRDISRAGVGFVADRFIEPSSMWRMHLTNRHFIIGSIVLMIRYCRLVESELHICGGQVVVEPHLLNQLGVPSDQARHEHLGTYTPLDVAEFHPPSTA